jgi:hypothetical protein
MWQQRPRTGLSVEGANVIPAAVSSRSASRLDRVLAAIHGISVFLATIGVIILGGFVVQTIGLDIRRRRKRRHGHYDSRRGRR